MSGGGKAAGPRGLSAVARAHGTRSSDHGLLDQRCFRTNRRGLPQGSRWRCRTSRIVEDGAAAACAGMFETRLTVSATSCSKPCEPCVTRPSQSGLAFMRKRGFGTRDRDERDCPDNGGCSGVGVCATRCQRRRLTWSRSRAYGVSAKRLCRGRPRQTWRISRIALPPRHSRWPRSPGTRPYLRHGADSWARTAPRREAQ